VEDGARPLRAADTTVQVQEVREQRPRWSAAEYPYLCAHLSSLSFWSCPNGLACLRLPARRAARSLVGHPLGLWLFEAAKRQVRVELEALIGRRELRVRKPPRSRTVVCQSNAPARHEECARECLGETVQAIRFFEPGQQPAFGRTIDSTRALNVPSGSAKR
jgi:hypothetical protein